MLSQQDFLHAGAGEDGLTDVIDELIASSPEARVVVLIYEMADRNICAIVRTERPHDAISLTRGFNASGTREEVRLCFTKKTVVQVEQDLLEKIKAQITK